MSKKLAVRTKANLAAARKEYAALKAQQEQKNSRARADQSEPMTTKATTPLRDPNMAARLLLCSQYEGEASLLTFKLTDTTATTNGVTALQGRTKRSGSGGGDDDSVMLQRKLKISHDYEGCPHCGGSTMVLCTRCDALSCHQREPKNHRCPGCGCNAPLITMTDPISFTGHRARPEVKETVTETRTLLTQQSTALTIRGKNRS